MAFEPPATTEIWDSLPKSIRDSDEKDGTLFLKRLFFPLEHALVRWDGKIAMIPAMLNPETTREDLIDYMLPRVGIDEAVSYLYEDRHPHDKRKLHRLAMPMWRSRYSDEGLHSTLRTIAGSDSDYWSWFDLRTILGEVHEGEAMVLVGDPVMVDGESRSLVKLMDNGTVDEGLVLELVNMHRPLGEHIDVLLFDFYDQFETAGSRARWETVDGFATATFDVATGKMLLGFDAAERPLVPIAPAADFTNVFLSLRYTAQTDGDALHVRFFELGDSFYDIFIEASAVRPNVLVLDQDAVTLFDSDLLRALTPGIERTLRIEAYCGATMNRIALYIDGDLVFNLEDTGGSRSAGGHFWLHAECDPAMKIDEVAYSRIPGRRATVAPRGASTQTSNFHRRAP